MRWTTGLPMEKQRFRVFPDRGDDPGVSAMLWNSKLKPQKVVVLKSFGWEGRMTVPGEEMSLPVGDAKDLCFRHKARLLK